MLRPHNRIQNVWNVKAKVIPVIIGVTGTISKSLRRYLGNILGKQESKESQKKGHTVEKANLKVQNIFHR